SGGLQSSSVNAISGALAILQAAFRLAPGGALPGGCATWCKVPFKASGCVLRSSSVSGPDESCPTITSQRSGESVWSSSAFSSQRRRRGRSCEATTTEISGAGTGDMLSEHQTVRAGACAHSTDDLRCVEQDCLDESFWISPP